MSDDADHTPDRQTPRESRPLLRASDLDRRRVAAVLHEALGRGQLTIAEFDERTAQTWAAVHVSDLDPLTSDIAPAHGAPSTSSHELQRGRLRPPASQRVTGDGGPTVSIAVWSGFERKGVWTVPVKHTAVAFMGGGELDLRYANFGARHVTITAVAIMGGIDILVPADIDVRVEGIGIMGGFEDARRGEDRPEDHGPDRPIVTVNGLAIMGGVSVRRKPSGPVGDLASS